MLLRRSPGLLALCCTLALACGRKGSTQPGTGDAGSDAGPDGGGDAGSDAGPDGGGDAGSDAGSDAGMDAGALPTAPVLSVTTSLNAVNLSWTTSDDVSTETFTVSRSDDDGDTFNPLDLATDIRILNATDFEVTFGVAYQYEVAATNAAGTGPSSNVVVILAAPDDVNASGSDSRMIVAWGPIDNADAYAVYGVPASGAPALLGTTANNEYIDATVDAGGAYTYEVVATSASYPSSIASNPASGTALGIDIGGNITFISDTGPTSNAAVALIGALGLEAHVASSDGGVTIYDAVATEDAMVIPGVPAGPYAVSISGANNFVITSARALDYSTAQAGRTDLFDTMDDGTSNNYDITGLLPWSLGSAADAGSDAGPADLLEAMSQGADNFVSGLDQLANEPDAGDTVFTGDEMVSDESGDGNLVDSSEGDVLYIWQLHSAISGNGIAYQTAQRSFADTTLTMVDGQDNQVSGAMSMPAANAIADVVLPRSQWTGLLASANPAATDNGQAVYIDVESGYDDHGWYGYSGDALILGAQPGTTDLDLGAVSWQSPVPASADWDAFALLFANSNLNYTVGSNTSSFQITSAIEEPLGAGFDWTTALAPPLSPPQAPLIKGLSAFSDQTNAADANGVVTLSWSAPAQGTPDFYLVTLYELDSGADASELASFITKATSLAITPDQLPDAAWYMATVDAVKQSRSGAALDPTLSPIDVASTYLTGELATNKFTPGAAPSTRRPASDARTSLAAQRRSAVQERIRRLPPALRRLFASRARGHSGERMRPAPAR